MGKTTQRPSGKKNKKTSKPPTHEQDTDALEAFCAGVALDETSLESWQEIHESIDITVPLFLSVNEAAAGLNREVRFVRTIVEKDDVQCRRTKEKTFCEVDVPPQTKDGCVILLKNQGDHSGGRSGDVRIIIRIKA